eukprot:TRINITY_DN2386_c0_g1_i1.p1 TRINITY_DN2386_c0_g1~~TRINITY_DN2386_c0_g1_i1.p1  ORF type:complete len:344 (-),score=94.25 TRINITY_DN2386_c0_g1_i1:116-1147(-)
MGVLPLITNHLDQHRNNLFMTSKALQALHISHCASLSPPLLAITKTDSNTCGWESFPYMHFKLEDESGTLTKFTQFQIYVHISSKKFPRYNGAPLTLFLPFSESVDWKDHRGLCGQTVEMGLVCGNAFGDKLERKVNRKTVNGDQIVSNVYIPHVTLHYYCWNGEAQIHMYDGSTKHAEDVRIGDVLLGASGQPTVVKRVKETVINGNYKVVDMGDFLITRGHPVFVQKEWYRPDELYPVTEAFVDVLYNFYAEPEHFLVVGSERVICSSLGGYCPRLAEMDPFTDVLYGRGYGSYEAENYKWLLKLKERIPDDQVHPKIPSSYDDLYPGRENIITLGRPPSY